MVASGSGYNYLKNDRSFITGIRPFATEQNVPCIIYILTIQDHDDIYIYIYIYIHIYIYIYIYVSLSR